MHSTGESTNVHGRDRSAIGESLMETISLQHEKCKRFINIESFVAPFVTTYLINRKGASAIVRNS